MNNPGTEATPETVCMSCIFPADMIYSSDDADTDAVTLATTKPSDVHPKADIVKIYSTYEGRPPPTQQSMTVG